MEKPRHLCGRRQITVGVFSKQAVGGFQCSMISNAREDVENLAFSRQSVTNTVGRHERQPERFGKYHRLLIDRFFFAIVMTLQFDIDVFATKDVDQSIESFTAAFIRNGSGEWTVLATREADETAGVLSDLIFRDCAFTLRRAEFHASQEPAKILVTLARFGEERIANACCGSDFSADMRLETGFLRSEIKSRRAVNAVAVEKGHCRHRVFRACSNKFF